jgi:hypothetical protein
MTGDIFTLFLRDLIAQNQMKSFLGFIFTRAGIVSLLLAATYALSSMTFPLIWVIGSIAIIGVGIFLTRFSDNFSREIKARRREIQRLKVSGEKIKVDLTKCEVLGNSYSEEQVISHSQLAGLSSISNPDSNIRRVSVKQSVFECKFEVNGETLTFQSPTLNKDRITLQFLLEHQKETYIYIDKGNPDNWYFDLEFLEQ